MIFTLFFVCSAEIEIPLSPATRRLDSLDSTQKSGDLYAVEVAVNGQKFNVVVDTAHTSLMIPAQNLNVSNIKPWSQIHEETSSDYQSFVSRVESGSMKGSNLSCAINYEESIGRHVGMGYMFPCLGLGRRLENGEEVSTSTEVSTESETGNGRRLPGSYCSSEYYNYYSGILVGCPKVTEVAFDDVKLEYNGVVAYSAVRGWEFGPTRDGVFGLGMAGLTYATTRTWNLPYTVQLYKKRKISQAMFYLNMPRHGTAGASMGFGPPNVSKYANGDLTWHRTNKRQLNKGFWMMSGTTLLIAARQGVNNIAPPDWREKCKNCTTKVNPVWARATIDTGCSGIGIHSMYERVFLEKWMADVMGKPPCKERKMPWDRRLKRKNRKNKNKKSRNPKKVNDSWNNATCYDYGETFSEEEYKLLKNNPSFCGNAQIGLQPCTFTCCPKSRPNCLRQKIFDVMIKMTKNGTPANGGVRKYPMTAGDLLVQYKDPTTGQFYRAMGVFLQRPDGNMANLTHANTLGLTFLHRYFMAFRHGKQPCQGCQDGDGGKGAKGAAVGIVQSKFYDPSYSDKWGVCPRNLESVDELHV
jgi:hypothetical protein